MHYACPWYSVHAADARPHKPCPGVEGRPKVFVFVLFRNHCLALRCGKIGTVGTEEKIIAVKHTHLPWLQRRLVLRSRGSVVLECAYRLQFLEGAARGA